MLHTEPKEGSNQHMMMMNSLPTTDKKKPWRQAQSPRMQSNMMFEQSTDYNESKSTLRLSKPFGCTTSGNTTFINRDQVGNSDLGGFSAISKAKKVNKKSSRNDYNNSKQ